MRLLSLTHIQGKGWHAGFNKHGKCWRFRFSRREYANNVFYCFWRFFLSIDK